MRMLAAAEDASRTPVGRARPPRGRCTLPAAVVRPRVLTGIARDLPSFSQVQYAHGWVAGAFFAPGRRPLFVLLRMIVCQLGNNPPEEATVITETDGGQTLFAEVGRSVGPVRRLALGARTWGQAVLELQRAVAPEETVNG